jgi:hypothetical protein
MEIPQLSPNAQSKLHEIIKLFTSNSYPQSDEVAYVKPKLDIKARNGNKQRIVKHIHQQCQGLWEEFYDGSKIKWLYSMDAYIKMVESKNPVGIYSVARSILELRAVTRFIRDELIRIKSEPKYDYKLRGEQFHKVLVRARYGTSNPKLQEHLLKEGLSNSDIKVLHINDCLKHAESLTELNWLVEHYHELCDFVHHNFSSQNIGISKVTKASDRKIVNTIALYRTPVPMVHYEYPSKVQALQAIETTVEKASLNLLGMIEELNVIPHSPYSEKELLEYTGSRRGVKELPSPVQTKKKEVGRNEPCPCGSGRKFKHCHGKT